MDRTLGAVAGIADAGRIIEEPGSPTPATAEEKIRTSTFNIPCSKFCGSLLPPRLSLSVGTVVSCRSRALPGAGWVDRRIGIRLLQVDQSFCAVVGIADAGCVIEEPGSPTPATEDKKSALRHSEFLVRYSAVRFCFRFRFRLRSAQDQPLCSSSSSQRSYNFSNSAGICSRRSWSRLSTSGARRK